MQRRIVTSRIFGQHVLIGDTRGITDDRLQIPGQGIKHLLINEAFQGCAWLVPARVVVVLGVLVQAEGQVVVGADPFGGIELAGIEGRLDLGAGQVDRLGSRPGSSGAWSCFIPQPSSTRLAGTEYGPQSGGFPFRSGCRV